MKTRHWILYLFVWMAFFLTLFLTSCRTKTVTQDHYITDTSVSKGLEQTWQERFVAAFEQMAQVRKQEKESSYRETTHTKDSTSTIVDAAGKPIKTESWHEVITNKESREVTRLQDSLIRLKQDSIQVLSRELTKNEQRYITLGKFAMGAIIALILVIIGLAVWLWHRKKFANENNYN